MQTGNFHTYAHFWGTSKLNILHCKDCGKKKQFFCAKWKTAPNRTILKATRFYTKSIAIKNLKFFFVPTHFSGGGTIYSNGFFLVQSNLADRYNHRREFWVVSLKCPSSVEYGIKKIFSFFVFKGSYRGLKFCEYVT